MKHIQIKILVIVALLTGFMGACSDILDETPRATFTPEYFKTKKGVEGGVTYMYAHLRNLYGNGYYLQALQSGTDEMTYGGVNGGDAKIQDFSGQGVYTPTINPAGVVWGVFTNINTASGIIENGTSATLQPLVAEARFFRAFDYFLLVQNFGGVPLDLGAGELKFNTSAARTSVRNTVSEVYTKAIFPDLLQAIGDLPEAPRVTGAVTKTVARLYLAKAYLTYAWWLENPANVPTYPIVASPRVDPDGKTSAQYFQLAYDYAKQGIEGAGTNYQLMANFYDVNVATNDRNKEQMLYADHTQSSALYTGAAISGFGAGDYNANMANWITNFNFGDVKSSLTVGGSYNQTPLQREAVQNFGRPWTGLAPTHGVIINTFADKTNDARYDGTFVTVFRGNWHKANATEAAKTVLYNANDLPVSQGGVILSFLPTDPGGITWATGAGSNGIGAGWIAGRADWVMIPEKISRFAYPNLWKINPYRTDNGAGLGEYNTASTRPFVIAKFSEFFFIAAEAAVKGATTSAMTAAANTSNDGTAVGLINVIRKRAGVWKFDNGGNVAKVADNSAAMIAATPATITIDYILDERTREYYGEGYRWFDLTRTQTWHTRAASYTICATRGSAPSNITRNITVEDYLRPIPQSQIDGMEMTVEEKAEYQNPKYKK